MKSTKPNIIRLLMKIMLHNKIHSGEHGDLVVEPRSENLVVRNFLYREFSTSIWPKTKTATKEIYYISTPSIIK